MSTTNNGGSLPGERLTRQEAARYLGLTKNTLERWAHFGRYALPFIKVGARVQYLKRDLDEFLESRRVTNTRQLDEADADADARPARRRRGARRRKRMAAAGI
jgi:excisionase family DNA binding protein